MTDKDRVTAEQERMIEEAFANSDAPNFDHYIIAGEACERICPSDPMRAAEVIGEAFELLRKLSKGPTPSAGKACALLARLDRGDGDD